MRKLPALLVTGLGLCLISCLFLTTVARADQPPRKRKPAPPASKPPDQMAELLALMRRTQQAAEAAQEEARRAREQSESLQQKLSQTTAELATLRQLIQDNKSGSLAALPAELKSVLKAELKTELRAELAQPTKEAAPARDTSAASTQADAPPAEERLARLEEQVEVHNNQLKEHAQTKVESDSRFRVRMYGQILFNTYLHTADSPQRTAPPNAPSPINPPLARQRNFGSTLRQTTLGFVLDGPRVGSARLSAETEFDFYGGVTDDSFGGVLGQIRMRTGSVRLDWENTSLAAGLHHTLISPREPASLASVWYAPLSEAGNLWQWRPQINLERRQSVGESSQLLWQGGVMLPFGETLAGTPIEGTPSPQGRLAFRHTTAAEKRFEIGLAGLVGRRDFLPRRRVTAYVVSTDWLIPLGNRWELSGETYFSKANNLGEQSGIRADAIFAITGPLNLAATTVRGVHAFGGWSQLTFNARRDLDFNFAYGIEDPRNRDLFDGVRLANLRFRNHAASANFIYQLRANFQVSLEYRRLMTDYAAGRRRSDHYNLALGYNF